MEPEPELLNIKVTWGIGVGVGVMAANTARADLLLVIVKVVDAL